MPIPFVTYSFDSISQKNVLQAHLLCDITPVFGNLMFRMWIKEVQDNHFIKDTVICDDTSDTRTHKIFHALEAACQEFDLPVPIWLTQNTQEFKRLSKTRFNKDSFVEEIDFDYLEVQVIEEDDLF